MSKSYGKQEFVAQLISDMGLTKKQASDIYNSLFNQIEVALKDGYEVNLPFGKISLTHVKAAEKHNPKTMEKVHVPAHSKPVMHFFNSFKDAVENLDPTK